MAESSVRTSSAAGALHTVLQPPGWPRPKGFANGLLARGEMVFVGGMIGWDIHGKLPQGFVAQTRQLLENIVAVLKEGGAGPEHVVRMTWYVTDKREYVASYPDIGRAFRELVGDYDIAMTAVQVAALIEDRAKVEVEVTAVVED